MTSADFNSSVFRLSPPPIPSVLAWGRAYQGGKGPMIDLSQAVPGYPPHPDMLHWLGEEASSTANTGYGPIEGETALRKAYAAHVSQLYGANASSDNVHITSGCNQAFMCAAMAIAGAGDRLALTNPFYFNQETTLSMLGIGRTLVDCDPANGFLPDLSSLEKVLASGVKALALVTPNNPTGSIYPSALLHDIFHLCRRYGAWLILDETYRDFLPENGGRPHDLLSIENWEDTLILLYSFSKSFCIPGHRLGAITAGTAVVEQVTKVMDNLQICAPRSAQMAVAKALPALSDWRKDNRAEIEHRSAALKAVMEALPAWTIGAIGAYFAFIRHPFNVTLSATVAEKLAKQSGVLCLPGSYFGEGQEGFLRFAFANADAATIGQLHSRLHDFAID